MTAVSCNGPAPSSRVDARLEASGGGVGVLEDPGHLEGSPWFYAPPTVLVVDDDTDTRQLLALFLERDGVVVLQAADGETGLQLARRNDVDAVILDVMMPGLDGHSVCRLLREEALSRRIPVIMLTALSDLDSEVRSVVAGADAYITKPVRRAELLRRVRDII